MMDWEKKAPMVSKSSSLDGQNAKQLMYATQDRNKFQQIGDKVTKA